MSHPDAQVNVTVVVRCGFIGCDWSREIGTAPLEVHQEYLDHLDVHDPDLPAAAGGDDCDQEDAEPQSIKCPRCQRVSHNPNDVAQKYCGACHEFFGPGLYAGDTPGQIADAQARVDRFMAGGNDV